MKFPWTKKQPPAPVKIQIIGVEATKLQLSDWQKDKALVAAAKNVLNNDYAKLMVQVLKNEHVGNMVLPKNFPMELRSAHQSQCEGYTLCLANIEAMATLKVLADVPESTFEPEEVNLNQE